MIKIPHKESFPMFYLSDEDYVKLTEWMLSRPAHEDDCAVNGSARWEYKLIDHGVFSEKYVTDRATGEVYEIDSGDPSNW